MQIRSLIVIILNFYLFLVSSCIANERVVELRNCGELRQKTPGMNSAFGDYKVFLSEVARTVINPENFVRSCPPYLHGDFGNVNPPYRHFTAS